MAPNGGGRRWSLEGMTALVTGGTKGIGYAIVEELAGLGASVHTCSRNESELHECLSQWKKKGYHQVTGSACDVVSKVQREELIHRVSTQFHGKLNILINNVGTTHKTKPTTEYTSEDYSFIMSTNLESTYNLCQLAHPLLKASGAGNIVLISSVAGVVSIGVGSIYGVTKGAMNQLAKNLACEWAKDKIRINSVAPYLIKTPLAEPYLHDEKNLEVINSKSPLGRIGESLKRCLHWWPMHPGSLIHNRADYLRRWRDDYQWTGVPVLTPKLTYELPTFFQFVDISNLCLHDCTFDFFVLV